MTYRVGAGMRWFEVIRALDAQGFSPAVMQSNSDFGVGSTFCVNSHGWPTRYGPFGATLRAVKIVLADGQLVECSRTKEPELFALAMGGYGLFGAIVELELDMVPNRADAADLYEDAAIAIRRMPSSTRSRTIPRCAHGLWPALRSRARTACSTKP